MLQKLAERLFNNIEKFIMSQKYWIRGLGEGIQLYEHQDTKEKLLVNLLTGEKIKLISEVGDVVHITAKDIDFDSVDKLEYSGNAKKLYSPYYYGVEAYKNGVAMIVWTLYPDGRYFADEGGFGGENNDEVNVYGFIDKRGRVIIPFRNIENNEFDFWRKKAEELAD